ncbi:ABC transporter substrate-binding protein [Microvirga thermotolerans]|uniref:ABC transporter substrate-binding protein n=1 Tax=Microvirga thermotolerans TaxID=2651334 RepID=A0A5P9K4U6_9HYPH|nr:ABC transporter substrate-binding protein [Microvirga thermotolerans]QFU17494.1 ABC transporter substrate-binding protein [Microvirga thermotolerans]
MRPLVLFLALFVAAPAHAEREGLSIAVVRQERQETSPVSPLDDAAFDEGTAGARLGLADITTTGRFTDQRFRLIERSFAAGADPAGIVEDVSRQGARFIVTVADAAATRSIAEAASMAGVLVLNAQAPDDTLRNESCAKNLLHTVPSRAMLADGLAQYLAFKRWKRWFLVSGRGEGDRLLAEAFRRSARKFGAEIVVEKEWTFRPGNARADTGHVSLQSEIPAFTQVPDYDVLVVADEGREFGDYLEGRTARPRPVAGSHGLVATGWSPVTEQWGATQLQSRFMRMAKRRMTAVDYAAWAAVRSIGEAAFRTDSEDAETVASYLRGPDFLLSGFKGQGQSFRPWDGQMRQPILIAGPRLLVSVSPQPGFLHRTSQLDTLGQDREESRCKL